MNTALTQPASTRLSNARRGEKSLYNNFASKDELVATYLTLRHQGGWRCMRSGCKPPARRARVLAVFKAYEDHAEYAYEHGFRGCGLLNAAAELPAAAPGRQAVRRHKEEVEAILLGHLLTLLDGNAEQARLMARHFAFAGRQHFARRTGRQRRLRKAGGDDGRADDGGVVMLASEQRLAGIAAVLSPRFFGERPARPLLSRPISVPRRSARWRWASAVCCRGLSPSPPLCASDG